MQASELRIGNYVSNQTGELRDILIGKPHKFLIGDFVWADGYVPIPLTKEWLLKFGFEKRDKTEDGIIYGILNFTLIYGRTYDNDFCYFLNGYHNDCHLKYVHQLQNLYFALTGTELIYKP